MSVDLFGFMHRFDIYPTRLTKLALSLSLEFHYCWINGRLTEPPTFHFVHVWMSLTSPTIYLDTIFL